MCVIEIEDGAVGAVPKLSTPGYLDDNLTVLFVELNPVGDTAPGRNREQWLSSAKVEQGQLATVLSRAISSHAVCKLPIF